jgi:MarR family
MSTINRMIWGKERHAPADLVIRLVQSYRDDYLPDQTRCAAFQLIFLLDTILRLDESGRPVTGSTLARATEIPRPTVQRRLAHLIKKGLLEGSVGGF